jgi:hypothetical protein
MDCHVAALMAKTVRVENSYIKAFERLIEAREYLIAQILSKCYNSPAKIQEASDARINITVPSHYLVPRSHSRACGVVYPLSIGL